MFCHVIDAGKVEPNTVLAASAYEPDLPSAPGRFVVEKFFTCRPILGDKSVSFDLRSIPPNLSMTIEAITLQ
jgi:hypothetical protein